MSDEQEYYDALALIASMDSCDQIGEDAQSEYGLEYDEALEMAYENAKEIAQAAIRGKQRPNA